MSFPSLARPAPVRSASGPRVLLVDDDVRARTRLARALRQRGYRVVETPSHLFEALLIHDDSEAPDIIVSSAPLQDDAGIAGEGRPALIVLSSREAPASKEGARAVGATALFEKPVDPEEVCMVCELIARPPHELLLD